MAKVRIKGIDQTITALRKLGSEAEKMVNVIIDANAEEMVGIAKKLVRVDNGKLRQSIQSVKIDNLHYRVEAGGGFAPYAPYVEYGTGGLVEVPKEFTAQALLAKGNGVKQVNLMPRPFMYPAFLQGKKNIQKDLKTALDVLSKKV